MYTLNTIEQHSVCYTMNSKQISMMVSENKSNTLASDDYKEPQVVCYGISRSALKGGSGSDGGMPIEKEKMPSMTANGCGAVAYAIENHPCDSRVTLTYDGVVQTLNARMGTGGGNVPLILEAPK